MAGMEIGQDAIRHTLISSDDSIRNLLIQLDKDIKSVFPDYQTILRADEAFSQVSRQP